jgi:hypothetical protein
MCGFPRQAEVRFLAGGMIALPANRSAAHARLLSNFLQFRTHSQCVSQTFVDRPACVQLRASRMPATTSELEVLRTLALIGCSDWSVEKTWL